MIHSVSPLKLDDFPSELIVKIIISAVHVTDHAARRPHERLVHAPYFPYTALFINWRWHWLVLNTKAIWTTVYVRIDDDFDAELFRIRTRCHVDLCQTLASHMRLIIQVYQRYDQCGGLCRTRRVSDDMIQHHGPPFLASLKDRKASWTDIAIISHDNICAEFIRGHLLMESGQDNNLPLQDLRGLDIEVVAGQCGIYRSGFESIIWASQTVPNLRRLRIKSLQLRWDPSFLNVSSFQLNHLRSLCLDQIHASAIILLGKLEAPALEALFVKCHWNAEDAHEQRVRELIAGGTVSFPALQSAILINIPDPAVTWLLAGLGNVERLGISSLDRYLGRPMIKHLLEDRPCPALSTLALIEDMDCDHAKQLVEIFADKRTQFLREIWTVRGRDDPVLDQMHSEEKQGGVRHHFFSAQDLEPEALWKQFDV